MNYPGNYTKSEVLEVPRFLKTRPNAPRTKLAYITPEEEGILALLKPGTPHKGPENIPNYDTWAWSGKKKDQVTGGSTAGHHGASWTSSGKKSYSEKKEKPKQFSYSTKDVRSSPKKRQEFRDRTGSQVITPSERIARTKSYITGKDKFLNMPIFTPSGISYDKLSDIASQGESLIDYEQESGKLSKDWKDWFKTQEGFTDITGDDWASTSKGWYYEGETDEYGNPIIPFDPGGPSGSYGYGSGYGDDIAAYYGSGLSQDPKQLGAGEEAIPSTELLDYMIRVNRYNPYTKQAMVKDGGLLSLLR